MLGITPAKVAAAALLAFVYLNPWIMDAPLIGLLAMVFIPLKLLAEMFSTTVPGLMLYEGGTCFPASPAMAVISFIYSYIIVGAAISLRNWLGAGFKAPENGKGAVE